MLSAVLLSRTNFVYLQKTKNTKMSTPITLVQKKFIETHSELKSPQIAKELGISVWTVRKWRSRIKKGNF